LADGLLTGTVKCVVVAQSVMIALFWNQMSNHTPKQVVVNSGKCRLLTDRVPSMKLQPADSDELYGSSFQRYRTCEANLDDAYC